MNVRHTCHLVRQRRQLMKMRGKHAQRSFVDNLLADRPGEPETVVRRCPAAELVDQDQRVGCGRLDDRAGLQHLRHERRNPFQLRVARADACQHRIHDGQLGSVGRYKAADLRHHGDHTELADVRTRSGHVGTRDDHETRLIP
jgi:hypothetical protein